MAPGRETGHEYLAGRPRASRPGSPCRSFSVRGRRLFAAGNGAADGNPRRWAAVRKPPGQSADCRRRRRGAAGRGACAGQHIHDAFLPIRFLPDEIAVGRSPGGRPTCAQADTRIEAFGTWQNGARKGDVLVRVLLVVAGAGALPGRVVGKQPGAGKAAPSGRLRREYFGREEDAGHPFGAAPFRVPHAADFFSSQIPPGERGPQGRAGAEPPPCPAAAAFSRPVGGDSRPTDGLGLHRPAFFAIGSLEPAPVPGAAQGGETR